MANLVVTENFENDLQEIYSNKLLDKIQNAPRLFPLETPYPVRYIINEFFLHPISLHVRTPYVRA